MREEISNTKREQNPKARKTSDEDSRGFTVDRLYARVIDVIPVKLNFSPIARVNDGVPSETRRVV